MIGGFVGLIGALFGHLAILFLFIAIFDFDAFVFLIEVLLAVFIVGLILTANGVLKVDKKENAQCDDNEVVFPSVDKVGDYTYALSSEGDLLKILDKMPPYPKTYKRIARKRIRSGSKIKRRSDGEILYVIEVLKYAYKCYDFTLRECVWLRKDEIVTD